MAGMTSHIAYRLVDRGPNEAGASEAVWDVVVTVSVVGAALELGVTVEGLNVQSASTGNPLQEKLTGLVKEPCGVTVKVNVPGRPAAMVTFVGLEVNVKSAAFTV
jgi:hypothetical protein